MQGTTDSGLWFASDSGVNASRSFWADGKTAGAGCQLPVS